MKMPLKCIITLNYWWSSLNHRMSLNNIALSLSECACSSVYHQEAFVIAITLMDFTKSSFDYVCQLIWILFLPKVHCIAPDCSTFKGWLKSFNVIFVKDFANSVHGLLFENFLVLELTCIFQRSCLFKCNCWNKIRDMLVFSKYFWKLSFFGQRPNTHHSIHVILCLFCILKIEINLL
jgi:hypothetical protein